VYRFLVISCLLTHARILRFSLKIRIRFQGAGHEYKGSKKNNILPQEQFRPYFFLDTHESDRAKRYKGLIRRGSTTTTMQFDLYYSADGFRWTAYENNPIIDTSPRIGRWGPTNFAGWDPIRQVYVAHLENCLHKRCALGKRVIGRAESPDMIRWTDPETILIPDKRDYPDTEFYAMPSLVYEGIHVGLLWNFRTTNTTILPQVVFSRDGIHYNREFREPFIRRGDPNDFDAAVVYVNAPVVYGDQIFTYYTGANWRSPQDLLDLGDKAIGAIGLAVTPLDGFVSVDGGKGSMELNSAATASASPNSFGQMTTRSFTFSGNRLYLNVECALQQWGAGPCDMRVEVLGSDHTRVSGFELDDADPITDTGVSRVVSWRDNPDLHTFEGKPIRLRLYFKNAKLYSFQFRSVRSSATADSAKD